MIKMAYPDKCFQPGQRVRIRWWDDMLREFGYDDEEYSIPCEGAFIPEMKYLCGQEFTIKEIHDNRRVSFVENDEFQYSLDMIEPIYAQNHHCVAGTAQMFE